MAHDTFPIARKGPFSIDACACGQVHIRIGYTTLTLSEESFHLVARLCNEASITLSDSESDPIRDPHMHQDVLDKEQYH